MQMDRNCFLVRKKRISQQSAIFLKMKKTTRFISIKGTLNRFCKHDFLKAKLNKITLYVNKIILEAYLLANMHINEAP
jgi:hypothetical protein